MYKASLLQCIVGNFANSPRLCVGFGPFLERSKERAGTGQSPIDFGREKRIQKSGATFCLSRTHDLRERATLRTTRKNQNPIPIPNLSVSEQRHTLLPHAFSQNFWGKRDSDREMSTLVPLAVTLQRSEELP